MHELRIAQNIIESVLAEMSRRGLRSVRGVGLRIGELTDIVPESLEFGFDVLISSTALAGAQLEIERVPIRGQCRDCGSEFTVEDMQFLCPACGANRVKLLQGQELDICYLEVDETIADKGKTALSWPG